jgi:hypothetical protein
MPDLPSDPVTFLFTDIASSTALWERDRVAGGAIAGTERAGARSHPQRCERRKARR